MSAASPPPPSAPPSSTPPSTSRPPELITAVVTENGVVGPIGEANTLVAQQIADIARSLYARGWMPGTAGNISVRTGETAVITGSGLSKGELTADDMVTVTVADSQPVSGSRRPSAETAIHTAIYRATNADAVVHVHAPHATAQTVGASQALDVQWLRADQRTGRDGHHQHPGFHQSLRRRAHRRRHRAHLTEHPDAPPVLFIAGHGITAWGADLAQARDRVECLEAMCELATLTGRRRSEPVSRPGGTEMTLLQVMAENDAAEVRLRTDDARLIGTELATRDIVFDRRPIATGLDVQPAARADLGRIRRPLSKHSTVTAAIGTSMSPRCSPTTTTPAGTTTATAARSKFLAEHRHAEDEVRFFVAGRGCFYLHLEPEVLAVVCEGGDLLSVPAGTRHWFDMGARPDFVAIRFFEQEDGWIGDFTGDRIGERFPTLDQLVAA